MKKLYRKGSVHPTPPLISDQLAFLPAAIMTLTVALSPEDREVLAYLISCSSGNFYGNRRNAQKTSPANGGGFGKSTGDHPPSFGCNCFRCYMSYWVRWDSSPNRQLIHEIIDAFEDGLVRGKKEKEKNKKGRRKRGCSGGSDELKRCEQLSLGKELVELESVEESPSGGGGGQGGGGGGGCGGGDDIDEDDDGEEGFEKGSVRRFVSFLGERIWSVWT